MLNYVGKGNSAVGLTAYISRDADSGELVLESGALVSARNVGRVYCIHPLMSKKTLHNTCSRLSLMGCCDISGAE